MKSYKMIQFVYSFPLLTRVLMHHIMEIVMSFSLKIITSEFYSYCVFYNAGVVPQIN